MSTTTEMYITIQLPRFPYFWTVDLNDNSAMGRLDFPSILLKWWLLPIPISLKLNASELLRALPRFKHLDFGILETSIWLIFYRELY